MQRLRLTIDLDATESVFGKVKRQATLRTIATAIARVRSFRSGRVTAFELQVLPDSDSIAGLEQSCRDRGLTEEDLNEIIHDLASGAAATINNEGLSRQIEYLCAQLGMDQAQAMLNEIPDAGQSDADNS